MTETLAVTPPHLESIEGPAAWKREDLEGATDWIRPLSPATLSELTAAVEKIEAEGKTLETVVAEDFALPSFGAEAREILDVIRRGRGIVLLRGLPRDEATNERLCLMYWGLGSQLGSTVGQNVKGDRMFSVINEGQDIGKAGQRGSKSPYALGFHTDSSPAFRGITPDIIGLLALQTARRGGSSIVVSTATLHNELLRKAPAALKRLYGLYHFDRRSEIVEGEEPTIRAPVFTYDEGVRMRYASPYLLRGHEVAGEPLWTDDITPLIALHTIMEHRALSFRFDLEDGDILLLNNHAVMHARSAFDEHPEPERRRHLMRMWLKFFDE